jgi:membrane protein implicated in regulation of membrane protease activity
VPECNLPYARDARLGHIETDMTDYWTWWLFAALLVGAELVTGTFYLLAVGIALAAGGLAAWLGFAFEVQLVTAGVLCVVGTFVAHRWRLRRTLPAPAPFDVGQTVQVLGWKEDGSARVAYRGTQWDAEVAAPGVARADTMYIVGTRGSTLLIADRRA